MKARALPIFLMAVTTFSAPLAGRCDEYAWRKVDEDDSLTLYEADVPGSQLLAFKMEAVMDFPVKEMVGVLLDYNHCKDWIDHLEEYRIVKAESPFHFYGYTHIGTPIVLKDRDFVTEIKIDVRQADKTIEIDSRSTTLPEIPETGYVRGWITLNRYILTSVGPGKTRVIAESHTDPKGSVAKWIVNLFQRSFPKTAYRALLKRMKQSRPAPPADVQQVVDSIRF